MVMPASTIWPHPSTINNPGGHEITILVDPPSSSFLQKMGCHQYYYGIWPPDYLHFSKFSIFSQKLHGLYFHIPSQNELLLFSSSRQQLFTSSLAVLQQFLSSPISPFMQISHLHKDIPMAVNSSSLAFPVLQQ